MLERYHSLVCEALRALPAADPFTYSQESQSGTADSHAKQVIERTLGSAPLEITSRILEEYFSAGPLEPLLRDPSCTEIIVNGPNSIWIERGGRLQRSPEKFLSSVTLRNFVSRLSREAGLMANLDCPFADGRWRDCRVHLIVPPASGEEPVLTLRKHPVNPWTLNKLTDSGWASPREIEALERVVRDRMNFVVVGGTGSGKTSVLNACLASLPEQERAVIIEDTSELHVPNFASTKLLTRRDPQGHLREIDLSELVRHSLRMRPDRLVMGEIRGGEAKDLLMAFATGHNGCMGTLHAESARQALARLEMLVQLGAPQWNTQAVRSIIHFSIQAVVVVGRDETGVRRLEGIHRIASLEDVGFLMERMT
ncbi:MAG: ATPase, T2SS/T4P/T4SS family [Bdellovibrionota bacterium]